MGGQVWGCRVRWVGVVALVCLAACGGRRGRIGIDSALAAADAAYRPGEPGFEDEVERLLGKVDGEGPEVLWRRARLAVARGQSYADPIAARQAYADARALAVACLDGTVAVRRRRIEGDWPGALALVPESASPCVGQLAWAWTRWFLAADPQGAALDRFALDALVKSGTGRESQWAGALLAGLDGDRRTADTLLVALSAVYPNDLAIVADRIAWVLIPSGDQPAAEERLEELRDRVRADVPRDVAALAAAERAVAGDLGAVPLPVTAD